MPLMLPAGYGIVVFTTGPQTTRGEAGGALLCASRHAVFGFAKDLACEMGSHQINVNLVAGAGRVDADPAAEAALTHAVLWLSSDASRFVTGTLVRADRETVTA